MMNLIVYKLIQYWFVASGSAFAEYPETKIIGGWEADIRQMPYHARIEFDFNNSLTGEVRDYCGATIIHRDWLLTAGHCITMALQIKSPIWLVLGVDSVTDTKNMPRKGDLLPRVDLLQCHPGFKQEYFGPSSDLRVIATHDICLLRTDHALEFGPYINRAGLPWLACDKAIEEKQLLVSGYGVSDTSASPKKLRFTKLKLVKHEDCERVFSNSDIPGIPSSYNANLDICVYTFDQVKRKTCLGDSGGGLTYKDSITGCQVVIGIVSQGEGACQGYTRYVKVAAYQSWIEETMERYGYPAGRTRTDIKYIYPERNKINDQ